MATGFAEVRGEVQAAFREQTRWMVMAIFAAITLALALASIMG